MTVNHFVRPFASIRAAAKVSRESKDGVTVYNICILCPCSGCSHLFELLLNKLTQLRVLTTFRIFIEAETLVVISSTSLPIWKDKRTFYSSCGTAEPPCMSLGAAATRMTLAS